MTIGIILLWMAMQGQAQHDPHAVQYAFHNGCWITYNEAGDTLPGIPCVSSTEHIIEIKTKREEIKERLIIGTVGSLQPGVDLSAIPCKSNQFLLLEHGKFYCARHRVVREIWIDGVKWGVLKGD